MTEIMPVPRNSHITVLRPPSFIPPVLRIHFYKDIFSDIYCSLNTIVPVEESILSMIAKDSSW